MQHCSLVVRESSDLCPQCTGVRCTGHKYTRKHKDKDGCRWLLVRPYDVRVFVAVGVRPIIVSTVFRTVIVQPLAIHVIYIHTPCMRACVRACGNR